MDYLKVRFLEDMPEFVGVDCKVYGSYVANTLAEVPFENAIVMISKGKAYLDKKFIKNKVLKDVEVSGISFEEAIEKIKNDVNAKSKAGLGIENPIPDAFWKNLLREIEESKEEARNEATSLLKDDKLLCRIREIMDKEIIGEYENKLLLFLTFLSKDLGAEHAQACFIMGESSSGKSYLMHKVLSYFPDECVIWMTRSTTHGLEYFCKGKDLTGHILAIEEAPGLDEAQP